MSNNFFYSHPNATETNFWDYDIALARLSVTVWEAVPVCLLRDSGSQQKLTNGYILGYGNVGNDVFSGRLRVRFGVF